MKKVLIFTLLAMFISGCASKARKNAEMYMKHKNYELAHPLWVQVLKKDPDDAEAQLAKQKCEHEIMGKRLISLRDLIIAKNVKEALAMARSIRDFKNKWGFQANYNGAQFERKELKKLYPSFIKVLNNEVGMKKSLLAYDTYMKNKDMFLGFDQQKLMATFEKIKKSGTKQCQKYKSKLNRYSYYDLYVEGFCRAFDQAVTSKKSFSNYLFSRININLMISSMPTSEQTLFKNEVEKDFKNSVWYHPNGQNTAQYSGQGKYRFGKKTRPIMKTHEYTVKEAYTVDKKVKDKNGKEEIKKVTKYKKVKKYKRYRATEVKTNYYLNLNAKVRLKAQTVSSSFLDSLDETDYESMVSMPKIGLRPHKPTNKTPTTYLKLKSGEYVKKVREDLSHQWRKKYCNRNGSNGSKELFIENVIRCLRLDGPSNPFVDNWFKKETGLKAAEALSYINIEHSKK